MDLSPAIMDMARESVSTPKMPVITIASAMRMPHLTRVAIQGTVTKVNKEMYDIEIELVTLKRYHIITVPLKYYKKEHCRIYILTCYN